MLIPDIEPSTRLGMPNMNYIDPDTTDINECMQLMLGMMKAASDLHYSTNFPMLDRPTFDYMIGKKYARFFTDNGNQRSVCFFVDMTTGDVWKADGWKRPALNFVRGNIMTKTGRVKVIDSRSADSNFYYYPGM